MPRRAAVKVGATGRGVQATSSEVVDGGSAREYRCNGRQALLELMVQGDESMTAHND